MLFFPFNMKLDLDKVKVFNFVTIESVFIIAIRPSDQHSSKF